MKTLNRYIFLEIFRFTGLSLIVFLGILVTARILKLTSLVINKGINISEIVIVFLAIIPSFLEIAIPMSVLLGTMLAFARLSLDSEIVVMRASGINLSSLIKPVFIIGLISTILCLLTSMYLRPLGNNILETRLFSLASISTTSSLTEGVFNKLGPLTIYSNKIDNDDGKLGQVLIDDRRNPDQTTFIVANAGQLVSDPDTRLLYLKLTDGSIHAMREQGIYNVTNFIDNFIKIDPQELASQHEYRGKKANEMLIPELKEIIYYLKNPEPEEDEPKLTVRDSLVIYQIELARKFTMPFACLILALLAMPLGIHPPRSQNTLGQALSVMIGMIIFVLYYAFLSIAMSISKDGTIEPNISMWLPNIVFFIITTIALNQMGSERWTSIYHAMGEFLEASIKKVTRS